MLVRKKTKLNEWAHLLLIWLAVADGVDGLINLSVLITKAASQT